MQATKPGMQREVFGSDVHREVALVLLPCARVRLSCRDRQDSWTREDASTTADCTYTQVPSVDPMGLPKISRKDKESILGVEAHAPSQWSSDAVPLYWGESALAVFIGVGLSLFVLVVRNLPNVFHSWWKQTS